MVNFLNVKSAGIHSTSISSYMSAKSQRERGGGSLSTPKRIRWLALLGILPLSVALISCAGNTNNGSGSSHYTLTISPRPLYGYIYDVSGDTQGGRINCGSSNRTTCSMRVASNTPLTLEASADTYSYLGAWTGGCSGTSDCKVTLRANSTVGREYGPGSARLATSGNPCTTNANGGLQQFPLIITDQLDSNTATSTKQYCIDGARSGAGANTDLPILIVRALKLATESGGPLHGDGSFNVSDTTRLGAAFTKTSSRRTTISISGNTSAIFGSTGAIKLTSGSTVFTINRGSAVLFIGDPTGDYTVTAENF